MSRIESRPRTRVFRHRTTSAVTLLILALLAGCAGVASRKPSAPESTTAPSVPAAGSTAPQAAPATATATAKPGSNVEPVVNAQWQQAYERALASLKANRLPDAERELTALVALEPKLAGPHANLGIVYHRMGRAADAVRALERAVELNPRPAYYNELGVVHRTAGRFDSAQRAYTRALELDADYAYAHLNLGILYDMYLQQLDKALPHYERYRALAPNEAGTVIKWIADLKQRSSRTADQSKKGTSG